MDCGNPTQEVSEGDNISNRARNCLCDILDKKVAAVCPCLKNLSKAKLKNKILVFLNEKISR